MIKIADAEKVVLGLVSSLIFGVAFGASGSLSVSSCLSGFAFVAWCWPEWVLLAIVITSPIMRTMYNDLLPPADLQHYKTYASLILFCSWFVRRLLEKRSIHLPGWICMFLSAWAGFTALSMVYAQQSNYSIQYLAAVSGGVAVFWITFQLEKVWERRILWAVLSVAAMNGIWAITEFFIANFHILPSLARYILPYRTQTFLQLYSLASANPADLLQRSVGTLLHFNQLGIYLTVMIPFVLALITVRSLNPVVKRILTGLSVTLILALYCTNSRDATLSLLLALVVLSLHRGQRWLTGALCGAILLAGVVYAASERPNQLAERAATITRINSGMTGREDIWTHAVEMLSAEPWLGVGPGNFSIEYVSRFGAFIPNLVLGEQFERIWYLQNVPAEILIFDYHAHNIYLQLAGELGVFGPLIFVVGVGLVILHCERRAKLLREGSYSRAVALATGAIAVGFVVYGMFDSQISITRGSLNLLFGPLLAIGLKA